MTPKTPVELDGRTGEGGGQLVRVAVALAAVTGTPVRITNVRGNRGKGERGGGLKSQHVASIQWLSEATHAVTEGLFVGSDTLEFIPRRSPAHLATRKLDIRADSGAASTLLIFQAILPFLIYAANAKDEPIELELNGGTNVSWSLSYEYLDQVLLPTLQDRFGLVIERQLKKRGWSLGPHGRGSVWLKIHNPVKLGESLVLKDPGRAYDDPKDFKVKHIDISMIVPQHMHEALQTALAKDLGILFPGAGLRFVVVEDSGHDARIYALLVARSATGLRWGRDILSSTPTPRKGKIKGSIAADISSRVSKDLFNELSVHGTVDEFLQDQLIIFQALASGRTSFPRGDFAEEETRLRQAMSELQIGEESMKKDENHEPFGHGSMHTKTARWVVSELLPTVTFFNAGSICEGVGWSVK